MGRRLLTLAIALNVKSKSYEVICYDLHKERLIPLVLESVDIEGKDGIYFDIGAITEVEALRDNEMIYPVGEKQIVDRYSRKQLRQLFEREYVNVENFIGNKVVNQYSIIKLNMITDLGFYKNTTYGILPTISFYANGSLQKNIIINDYRWLNYVRAISEKEPDKLNDYKALLNNQKQQVYLIMNRGKSNRVYVVGVHYL